MLCKSAAAFSNSKLSIDYRLNLDPSDLRSCYQCLELHSLVTWRTSTRMVPLSSGPGDKDNSPRGKISSRVSSCATSTTPTWAWWLSVGQTQCLADALSRDLAELGALANRPAPVAGRMDLGAVGSFQPAAAALLRGRWPPTSTACPTRGESPFDYVSRWQWLPLRFRAG